MKILLFCCLGFLPTAHGATTLLTGILKSGSVGTGYWYGDALYELDLVGTTLSYTLRSYAARSPESTAAAELGLSLSSGVLPLHFQSDRYFEGETCDFRVTRRLSIHVPDGAVAEDWLFFSIRRDPDECGPLFTIRELFGTMELTPEQAAELQTPPFLLSYATGTTPMTGLTHHLVHIAGIPEPSVALFLAGAALLTFLNRRRAG